MKILNHEMYEIKVGKYGACLVLRKLVGKARSSTKGTMLKEDLLKLGNFEEFVGFEENEEEVTGERIIEDDEEEREELFIIGSQGSSIDTTSTAGNSFL